MDFGAKGLESLAWFACFTDVARLAQLRLEARNGVDESKLRQAMPDNYSQWRDDIVDGVLESFRWLDILNASNLRGQGGVEFPKTLDDIFEMIAQASYRVGEAVASRVSTSGKIDCIFPSGTGFYVGQRDKSGNFFMYLLDFNFAERRGVDNAELQQEAWLRVLYTPGNDAPQNSSSPDGLAHQGNSIKGQPPSQSYHIEPMPKKQLSVPRGYVRGRARDKLVFLGQGETYWAKTSDARVMANRTNKGLTSLPQKESYQDFLAGFYGPISPHSAERAAIRGH